MAEARIQGGSTSKDLTTASDEWDDKRGVCVYNASADAQPQTPELGRDDISPTKLTTAEIGQRINEGNRRRAEINRSAGKKMMGHVGKVLLTFATMMATVSTHVVAPAVAVAHGVQECSQAFLPAKTERPWILELCGGHAEVTEQFMKEGYSTMRPRDIQYGDDLYDRRTQLGIISEIKISRPMLVVMGWPCTLWGSFANLNFKGEIGKQRLRRLRQKEKPILRKWRRSKSLEIDT